MPAAGRYEFRYFVNDSFVSVAVSNPITVELRCPSVSSIAPTSGPVGTKVKITGKGFTNTSGVFFSPSKFATYKIDSDTQITATVSAGATSGTLSISKSSCSQALSGEFIVTAPYTLTLPRQVAAPGGAVPLSWTALAGSAAKDWIGLYKVGDGNNAPISRFYTNGATSGTRNVTMPNVVGQYEFRYFTNNSFTLVMKSNVVTVSIGL